MWFRIDSQSAVRIYRQITAQVEQAVVAGLLEPGDKLPGVRELAVRLAVNPTTVVKAYHELQRTGVVEQPRGRGTFVRGMPVLPEAERRKRLPTAVANLVAEARRFGFDAAAILVAVRSELGEAGEGPDRAGR